jgi:hypothetical protein
VSEQTQSPEAAPSPTSPDRDTGSPVVDEHLAARQRYLTSAQAYSQALNLEGVYTNPDAASTPVQKLRAEAEAATSEYIAMVEAQGREWEDPEPEPPWEPEPENAIELEPG